MKRALRLVVIFFIGVSISSAPVVSAAEAGIVATEGTAVESTQATTTPVSSVKVTPKIKNESLPAILSNVAGDPPLVLPHLLINKVVAGITGRTSYEYIELHNPNSHDVVLESWKLGIFRKDGDLKQEFIINGTVKAKGYMLIAGTDAVFDDNSDLRLKTNILVTTGGIVQLSDALGETESQVRWGDVTSATLSLGTGTVLDRNYTEEIPSLTGNDSTDFANKPIADMVPRSGDYLPYVEPVHRCDGVIISEIAANAPTDKQFVEIYNKTDVAIDLDGCLLQTNRSATASEALTGVLPPGEYKTLYLADTELTLTKTTIGTVYLLSSDGREETDVRDYEGLSENTSWAWFGSDDWRQTFALTPNSENVWREFLPCDVGYERNEDTGRCRKIVAETVAAECGPGKYRNPETNRCRNIEMADAITPCKAGQYRNPETNRCRSAAVASSLQPCKEGQERNPETNRCRNVAGTIPEAAFSVEPIAEAGEAFVGWWALGGVGVLALGYGVWEWRREVFGAIKKVGTFFTSSK